MVAAFSSTEINGMERRAMPFQPGLRLIHVRAKLFAQGPEGWSVVHLPQMGDFMSRKVIYHGGRGHDDALGEAELVVPGA
jgi:hypothetical protein